MLDCEYCGLLERAGIHESSGADLALWRTCCRIVSGMMPPLVPFCFLEYLLFVLWLFHLVAYCTTIERLFFFFLTICVTCMKGEKVNIENVSGHG